MKGLSTEIVIDQVNDNEVHLHKSLVYFDDQCISCRESADTEIYNNIEYLPSTLLKGLVDRPSLETRLPICKKCNSALSKANYTFSLVSIFTLIPTLLLLNTLPFFQTEVVYWGVFLGVIFASSYLFEVYDRMLNWKILNYNMTLKDKAGDIIILRHKNPQTIRDSIDRAKHLLG